MGFISTVINPAVYVETAVRWVRTVTVSGGTVTDNAEAIAVAPRPGDSSIPVQVRDAETGAQLADTIADEQGYIPSYNTGASRLVEISADGGTTWVGPFPTREHMLDVAANLDAAATLGQVVSDAVAQANAAAAAANAAAATASAIRWGNIPGQPSIFPTESSQIVDASAVGKSVLTAADAAAARTALGVSTGGSGGQGWVMKSGGVWPARPTAGSSDHYIWVGAAPGPTVVTSGTSGMYDGGVDIWVNPSV